ncbi:dTDP-4-dehydrorhamnose reductase [Clostridium botulinum]|uniref:dTDP-4-dehydrorhamnose reductase n=1 Tax=Clostridium botulinum TaxID=1491 RepID=UPI0002A21213|nr:dTDP-4-dehydrorhamnose reductase [Clostridium botulinum]EKX81208.1 dTDP-4-dehydrorhamnose reductase [Clostridium botulinum CFSAN001628]MBD5562185.1 dTDP-4-dehydrorhamnose reductase [Clostridium botulinum]MBD5567140.1 dTDP-4-dehydrorhamnose reductase [Clostridium botulinum]MBD5570247.1 dTDP-4-dehydrorhamnose reductase [Clostridium botulinum]MBD5574039.1 dTDP-4-dehydrorhamnose reductase [Clostridium botulinum]
MKILITGAKGQLGSQIVNILKASKSELGVIDNIYINTEIIATDSKELDITNLNSAKRFMEKCLPNIVINCAAYTNVDSCEDNYELAFKVNSLGARNLAIACEKIKAKLIHISTDYVFEGNGQAPYKEYDLNNPVSVYGKSKLLGERYVKEFCSRYFIVRTSWLYGYSGNNFVKTIIKAAKGKRQLQVVDDQIGNPTNAEDLAYHILKLPLTEEYGIYHCTGSGECSWYDFACKIVEFYNIDCKVDRMKSDKLNRKAKRPYFSSLDNMMLRCTIGDEMRNWQDALKVFINTLRENNLL